MPFEPGVRLDAYEIVRPLGSGGMGEVWLATEVRLGRKVALKLLPADLTSEPSRVLRFEQEARAASALSHPNVCTIHALGENADGLRYIAMEYVEGETLRQRLASTRLSVRAALDIAVQVAAALSAAHASGIVHRDIKPENVMLRPDGFVKVLDFGLAKLVPSPSDTAGADSTRLVLKTEAGVVVGTAAYMSPEQARGQEVDARTDIWSLGVLVYEMVAGRSPFAAPSGTEVLAAILDRDPLPLARFEPETPAELQRIVTKCLRKERALRYQTVQDLLLDLQALRDDLAGAARSSSVQQHPSPALGEPTSAPPPVAVASHQSSAEYVATQVGRHRLVAIVAVGVLAGLLTLAWWTIRRPLGSNEGVRTGAPVLRNLTRLTFGPGLQTDVTWSPDGRFIAYASDRAGNFDIWVQAVEGGDPVQVTRDAAQDVEPAWSPDGTAIVFRSERLGGGLFLVPALGGAERQLTTFGTHPSWLTPADILFMVGNVDAGGGVAAQLFIVTRDGEGLHQVLGEFLAGGGLYWAAGHPEGRISVYGDHRTRGSGFFTLSRDGKQVSESKIPPSIPLQQSFLQSSPTRFRWSHAGDALFVEAMVEGIQNLWRVAVDPRTFEWLRADRLTTGPGRDAAASLSRDGTRLAYTTSTEHTRVYAQALSPGGRGVTGSLAPVTEDNAEVFGAEPSPDGRRLLYVIRRAGRKEHELRVVAGDGGPSELLEADLGGAVAFGWTPDGAAVLHIQLRTTAGRTETALVRHERGGRHVVLVPWSQDTAFLPWSELPARNGFLGIAYNLAGKHATIEAWTFGDEGRLRPDRVVLADPAASLWEATYSPNRGWIAFVRQPANDPQRMQLMIGPAEGGPSHTWRRVAADHLWPDKPRWSADGRLLYFLSREAVSLVNVWAVAFDPVRGVPVGRPFQITHLNSPSLFISPHFEKTGMGVANGRLFLTMSSATGSIWMLDNVDK